jgi:hypothetical protein
MKRNRSNIEMVQSNYIIPDLKDCLNILITFILTVFAWIFFRAENLSHAFQYVGGIFHNTFALENDYTNVQWGNIIVTLSLIFFFVISEWYGRFGTYGLQELFKNKTIAVRWTYYTSLIFLIIIYYQINRSTFIYFQF